MNTARTLRAAARERVAARRTSSSDMDFQALSGVLPHASTRLAHGAPPLAPAAELGGWRTTRHPGVAWRPLHLGEGEDADATVLIRMEPGASYPEHEHVGVEEVLILAGGYRDGQGEHRAGSYLRYPPGSRHAPVALGDPRAPASDDNPACLLFAVAHRGVRLTAAEGGERA